MCNCIFFDFNLRGIAPRERYADRKFRRPDGRPDLLDLLDLYQVLHFTDHTQYLRSSFDLLGGMHLLKTKSLQGQLLTLGPVDAALDLRDFDLCHNNLFEPPSPPVSRLADRSSLSVKNFL